MKKKAASSPDGAELRRQAEAQLSDRKMKAAPPPTTEAARRRLVRELQVYQIELGMQNKEVAKSRAQMEALLRQYADLYDLAPVGYFTLARDGAICRVNLTGALLLGVERVQLTKRHLGLFISAKSRPAFNAFLAQVFKSRGKETCEVALLKNRGEPLWVQIEATWSDASGGPECFAVVVDITERKRANEAIVQAHEQLRALAARWQNAIEDERAYIAREIHDDFGQSMTALKMDLTWLANRLPKGDARVDRVHSLTALVDGSIAQMHRIATELRPGLLDDLGLNAALDWQAREFSRRSDIPCNLKLPNDDLALDPALSTNLFRIFQETLTNVVRHAQATRVDASFQQEGKTLVLTVQDNGRGIGESELNDPHSLGLLGLRERAAQWSGDLTIRGTPGKGTTVTVRIPLPASPVNEANDESADRRRPRGAAPRRPRDSRGSPARHRRRRSRFGQ